MYQSEYGQLYDNVNTPIIHVGQYQQPIYSVQQKSYKFTQLFKSILTINQIQEQIMIQSNTTYFNAKLILKQQILQFNNFYNNNIQIKQSLNQFLNFDQTGQQVTLHLNIQRNKFLIITFQKIFNNTLKQYCSEDGLFINYNINLLNYQVNINIFKIKQYEKLYIDSKLYDDNILLLKLVQVSRYNKISRTQSTNNQNLYQSYFQINIINISSNTIIRTFTQPLNQSIIKLKQLFKEINLMQIKLLIQYQFQNVVLCSTEIIVQQIKKDQFSINQRTNKIHTNSLQTNIQTINTLNQIQTNNQLVCNNTVTENQNFNKLQYPASVQNNIPHRIIDQQKFQQQVQIINSKPIINQVKQIKKGKILKVNQLTNQTLQHEVCFHSIYKRQDIKGNSDQLRQNDNKNRKNYNNDLCVLKHIKNCYHHNQNLKEININDQDNRRKIIEYEIGMKIQKDADDKIKMAEMNLQKQYEQQYQQKIIQNFKGDILEFINQQQIAEQKNLYQVIPFFVDTKNQLFYKQHINLYMHSKIINNDIQIFIIGDKYIQQLQSNQLQFEQQKIELKFQYSVNLFKQYNKLLIITNQTITTVPLNVNEQLTTCNSSNNTLEQHTIDILNYKCNQFQFNVKIYKLDLSNLTEMIKYQNNQFSKNINQQNHCVFNANDIINSIYFQISNSIKTLIDSFKSTSNINKLPCKQQTQQDCNRYSQLISLLLDKYNVKSVNQFSYFEKLFILSNVLQNSLKDLINNNIYQIQNNHQLFLGALQTLNQIVSNYQTLLLVQHNDTKQIQLILFKSVEECNLFYYLFNNSNQISNDVIVNDQQQNVLLNNQTAKFIEYFQIPQTDFEFLQLANHQLENKQENHSKQLQNIVYQHQVLENLKSNAKIQLSFNLSNTKKIFKLITDSNCNIQKLYDITDVASKNKNQNSIFDVFITLDDTYYNNSINFIFLDYNNHAYIYQVCDQCQCNIVQAEMLPNRNNYYFDQTIYDFRCRELISNTQYVLISIQNQIITFKKENSTETLIIDFKKSNNQVFMDINIISFVFVNPNGVLQQVSIHFNQQFSQALVCINKNILASIQRIQ